MTTYRITAPDGKTYQIEGPPGASDEAVARAVIAQFPQAAQRPQSRAPQEEVGMLRRAADVPVLVGQGFATGFRLVADAFGANNQVSQAIRGVEDYLGELASAEAQGNQQRMAEVLEEAKDKGVLEQVKIGLRAVGEAPLELISQAFGTIGATAVAGAAGKILGTGAAVARGAGAAQALQAGVRGQKIAGGVTGLGMGLGVGKGAIYEAVKEELMTLPNMSEEQAEKTAQEAQSYGGENLDQILLAGALGAGSALVGADPRLAAAISNRVLRKVGDQAAREAGEQVAAKAPGIAGSALRGGAAEFATEFPQGAQEELAANIALQREGFDVPTFGGVFASGTVEGIAGAGVGAGVGVATRPTARRPQELEAETSDADIEATPDVDSVDADPADAAPADTLPADADLVADEEVAPPVNLISEQDIVNLGEGLTSENLPFVRSNVVGKTREELAVFAEENPDIAQSESPTGRIIRGLLAQPAAVIPSAPPVVAGDTDAAGDIAPPSAAPTATPPIAATETPSGITTPEAIETETQEPQGPAELAGPVIEDVPLPVDPADSWNSMNQGVRMQVAEAAGLSKPENFSTKKWGSLSSTVRGKLGNVMATQEASAAPPAGEGRVPSIENIEDSRMLADLEKERRKVERGNRSLIGTLRRIGMRPEDIREVYGRKLPIFAQSLRIQGRQGTSISTMVANGTLDEWLPYDNRLGAANFDAQTAEEIIKDRLMQQNYLTVDTEIAMSQLDFGMQELERDLRLEDINAELEIATQEQRDIDQEAEADAARPKDRDTGRAEEAQAGAVPDIELTPTTPETFQAEEERAKQAAAEEARAVEEAEKAKAEAGKERERKEIAARSEGAAEDFQLGQDAEANLTGQKDIFSTPLQISPEQQKREVLDKFESAIGKTTPRFRAIKATRSAIISPKALTATQIRSIKELAAEAIDLGMPASLLDQVQSSGSTGMASTAAISESGYLLLGKDWAGSSKEAKLHALIHELGHAADTMLDKPSGKADWGRATNELRQWYDASSTPLKHPLAYPFAPQFKNKVRLNSETFAQAFSFYFTSPTDLQVNAPEAYSQIQSIVEGIQNESQRTSPASATTAGAIGVKVQPSRTPEGRAVQPAAGEVGTGVGRVARGKDRAAERVSDGDAIEISQMASLNVGETGSAVNQVELAKAKSERRAENGMPIADPDAAKGKESKEAVKQSRKSIVNAPVDATWDFDNNNKELGLSDSFFYSWIDKQVDLKRVVDAIKATGRRVKSKFDAIEKERLYHGRVADRTNDYLENDLQPTLDLMKKFKISQKEIGEFLLNRHVPEANAQIAARNERFADPEKPGTTIRTADAIKYMESLAPKRKRQLEAVAKRMDETLDKMQALLVESGLESKETIAGWRDMFKFYIPLVRGDADYSINKVLSQGSGLSQSGPTSKARTGSEKEILVDQIFSTIAMQHERMILKAERARVGQAIFGLALENPNPGFWLALDPETNVIFQTVQELEQVREDRRQLKEILEEGDLSPEQRAEYELELDLYDKIIRKKSKPARAAYLKARDDLMEMGYTETEANDLVKQIMMPPMKARFDKVQNKVVYEPNASFSNDHVFVTRVNGANKYVLFNPKNERASRMVQSLKSMDAQQLDGLMRISASITRYFSAINTQYNPVFGAYNFLRDMQTATLQLGRTEIADNKLDVIRGAMPALRTIFLEARAKRSGKKMDADAIKDLLEFRREGGQTGFRDMYSQSEERANAIQRQIDPSSWADSRLGNIFTANGTLKVPFETMRKGAAPLFNLLTDYNNAMENAVRLSAYRVAREKFTKQGMAPADARQKAAVIAKEITVNFNQKGQMAVKMGALYSFFNASAQGTYFMAKALSGPTGRKIIGGAFLFGAMQAVMLALAGFEDEEPPEFIKSRNYIIPTGDGKYIAFPMPLGFNVLPSISRIVTEWALSGGQNSSKKALELLEVVMDMYNPIGNAGLSLQTLTPTLLDPLVALAENKDWTGKDISREDFSGLDPTPGHTRSRESTTVVTQEVARLLNFLSGGTENRRGVISPTADQLEFLVGQVTGGVGRELTKTAKTVESTLTGEDLPSYNIPLFGRFFGDVNQNAAVASAFYRNLTELNIHRREIETLRKDRGDVQAYLRENPEARLAQMARAQYREVQKLRKVRRELLKADKTEQAKRVEEQINTRMLRLNERYRDIAN